MKTEKKNFQRCFRNQICVLFNYGLFIKVFQLFYETSFSSLIRFQNKIVYAFFSHVRKLQTPSKVHFVAV